MSSSDGASVGLEAAIEEYLCGRDAGNGPSRHALLSKYPALAAELAAFFDDLDVVSGGLVGLRQSSGFPDVAAYGPTPHPDPAEPAARGISDPLPSIRGFRLIEELGGGSQGVVFKAEQLGNRRIVALKVIREGAFATKNERRRFETEVELASRLKHPHIVSVYACGQDAGRDYYAMEFVDGAPLDLHAATSTLSVAETLDLFAQVCEAVGYAHQRGVIHRDLKPSNVIVDQEGKAHILDFGLAKPVESDTRTSLAVTSLGDFAGTWHYASPEQVQRNPDRIDVRTDVYSLGVMFYEMLTDILPYPPWGDDRERLARHIVETPPQRPSAFRRGIDDELDTIILCSLSKEPERRYQSAAALADDLRRYRLGQPIAAKRDSSWYVLSKMVKRHRWRVLAAGAVVLSLVAFSVIVSVLYTQAVAARATLTARMRTVRESQRYLTGKLDELSWARNRIDSFATMHPQLPESTVLRRTTYEPTAELLDEAVGGLPEDALRVLIAGEGAAYDATCEWLQEHDSALANLMRLVAERRFVFGIETVEDGDLALQERPRLSGQASQCCRAFTARAIHRFHMGNDDETVANLETTRLLLLDESDGRLFFQRVSAIREYDSFYDAVCYILARLSTRERNIEPYVAWTLREPPVPGLALALISERQRLAQLFEGSTVASGSDDVGHVDLDLLDSHLFGYFQSLGLLTDDMRRRSRSLAPAEVLVTLDRFLTAVAAWDDLPGVAIPDHNTRLRDELAEEPAWQLIRPMATRFPEAFQLRQRATTKRAVVILAALIQSFRNEHSRWPATLGEAVPSARRELQTDPYTGAPFGYEFVGGRPVIYSVGDGGVDVARRPSPWGIEGTHVVLFPYPPS